MAFRLEAVAMHEIARENGAQQARLREIGAMDLEALDERVREALAKYVGGLELRDETTGRAVAAWWDGGAPAELGGLRTAAPDDFGAAARAATQRLVDISPGQASDGLMLFVRARRDEAGPVVACLKLELEELHRMRFAGAGGGDPTAAIVPHDIDDLLPEAAKVLKAAMVPNPTGASDLRVVDDQLRDPASYWLRFLGAAPRPGEVDMTKSATAAVVSALTERTQWQPEQAAAVIAAELHELGTGADAIAPRRFVDAVATRAGVDEAGLWADAAAREPHLADPHYELTPGSARRLRTTYDLGEGIRLTGPTSALDQRMGVARRPAGGWEVTIRVAERPAPRRGLG